MNIWSIKQILFRSRDSVRACIGHLMYDYQASDEKFSLNAVKRVLIHRLDGKIGDAVCFAFFFRELKKAAPNVEIVAVITETMFPVYKLIPGIDRIEILPRKVTHQELIKFAEKIGSVDLYIHLIEHLRPRDMYFIDILRPKWFASLDSSLKSCNLQMYRYESSVLGKGFHMTRLLGKILEEGGGQNIDYSYVHIAEEERNKFIAARKNPVIGINPFGAGKGRRLSDDVIKDIINICLKHTSYDIEIISSPKERSHFADIIKNSFAENKRVELVPELSGILDIIGISASYTCIIGVDTGTAHCAAMYDIPQLVFYQFNVDNFNRWRAISPNAECKITSGSSLYDAKPAEISTAVIKFINEHNFNKETS